MERRRLGVLEVLEIIKCVKKKRRKCTSVKSCFKGCSCPRTLDPLGGNCRWKSSVDYLPTRKKRIKATATTAFFFLPTSGSLNSFCLLLIFLLVVVSKLATFFFPFLKNNFTDGRKERPAETRTFYKGRPNTLVRNYREARQPLACSPNNSQYWRRL